MKIKGEEKNPECQGERGVRSQTMRGFFLTNISEFTRVLNLNLVEARFACLFISHTFLPLITITLMSFKIHR